MWASAGGHVAVIQELMTHGADFQVKDNQGRWPLHWAAEKGHADAVDLLVKHLLDADADLHVQVSGPSRATGTAFQYECSWAPFQQLHM